MALTRARDGRRRRGVAGGGRSRDRRDPGACRAIARKVAAEAAEMRAMIDKEKPPRDLWDIKLVPGGLIDLEFIAQVAVLTGEAPGERPRHREPAKSWRRLSPAFADPAAPAGTGRRLCALFGADPDDQALPRPGRSNAKRRRPACRPHAAATDLPDLAVLEAHLKETAKTVRGHFERLLSGKQH